MTETLAGREPGTLSAFMAWEALDRIQDGVFVLDPHARFIYINGAGEQLVGLSRAEVLGGVIWERLPDIQGTPLQDAFARTLTSGLPERLEMLVPATDRWYEHELTRLSDGVLILIRDVTERARDCEERERLVHELAQAVAAREEFISVAAHELNTPVSVLQLQTQAALVRFRSTSVPGADLLRRLEMLQRQGQRLGKLIAQLLDVSRINAGRLQLELEEVDLVAVVRDAAGRLAEAAAAAGCEVVVQGEAPVAGCWDRLRLDQIATNLLANAIKFGAGRSIEVGVNADALIARLTIRDHGIGMSADEQARLFQRFERSVPLRRYGGLGLGLWITRQLVEAHGGEIHVDSSPGDGALFSVDLPRCR